MQFPEPVGLFLEHVTRWAETRPDLLALGLVGSYARGTAQADSDIDLVLLVDSPAAYLDDDAWAETFGEIASQHIEDYGRVTSLRVFYEGGPEVEFGLAKPDWAEIPLDAGTREVIRGGLLVLHEKRPLLSRLNPEARLGNM